MTEKMTMKNIRNLFVWCLALLSCAYLAAQTTQLQPAEAQAFSSPKAAAEALVNAAEKEDVTALLLIFGPAGSDLVNTADTVQDKNNMATFAQSAREALSFEKSNPNQVIMLVGKQQWPMPVPIVKHGGKWYFDAKAGHDEVVFRRVGSNELTAIQVCEGFVEAQRQYALEAHDGVNQYAQKIISTPGKTDGLYWKNEDGTSGGPISEAIANALAEGYTFNEPTAYHGYYFKVLKGQGPAARLGRLDYVIDGVMIGGFAMVAVPADYRVTGVKTFIVSNDGTVYQKDLGPDSLEIAKKMELYDPDKSWEPIDGEVTLAE